MIYYFLIFFLSQRFICKTHKILILFPKNKLVMVIEDIIFKRFYLQSVFFVTLLLLGLTFNDRSFSFKTIISTYWFRIWPGRMYYGQQCFDSLFKTAKAIGVFRYSLRIS